MRILKRIMPNYQKKAIQPLDFKVYYFSVLGIALTGLGDSIYLVVSHYRIHVDLGYKSFCAISKALNCDTVSQSAYSIFLGLPLAVWGGLGYAAFIGILGLAALERARPWRFWASLQIISFFFATFSLHLGWVSLNYVGSFCIMCIVSFAVNFMLLYFSWLVRRRFNTGRLTTNLIADLQLLIFLKKQAASATVCFTLVLVLLYQFYPRYWVYRLPPSIQTINQGHTETGAPWIGASEPVLIINEYSDYLCFQCAKMHSHLRTLVNQYPERIRLVHHHYPMDHFFNPLVKEPFHTGAGAMALIAIEADTRGKFWEMNDLLFKKGRTKEDLDLRQIASLAGLSFEALVGAKSNPKHLRTLWNDIKKGLSLDIVATPTYVVDGKVYPGMIPPELIEHAIK